MELLRSLVIDEVQLGIRLPKAARISRRKDPKPEGSPAGGGGMQSGADGSPGR